MNDGNASKQIVDKIKSSTNILVTVSNDPSVDELSAALGLTLLLNKLDKHATAVFSGAIPPAITFLDPQKTFENTVNSLRDFIIALDKEKADHLRYKVEGDVVKIFITPYRTTITNDDLDFSQGDYNVELVLALGVKKRENLDKALSAHGRILHDATVATMSAGNASELGSIDWHEENVSSLSEMLVSLTESLKSDKTLLDEQIATAFLTGIVAATDRFSNNRTSSRVMTMAAQLMGAGANQQLIAAKLEDAEEISSRSTPQDANKQGGTDGLTNLSEGESTKVSRQEDDSTVLQSEPKKDDGELDVYHEQLDRVDRAAEETATRKLEEAARQAEENLAHQLPSVVPMPAPVADLGQDLAQAAREYAAPVVSEPELPRIITQPLPPLTGLAGVDPWQSAKQAPSMGGTLNATTEQAADEQRKRDEEDRNHTILSHGNNGYPSTAPPPVFQPQPEDIQEATASPVVPNFFAEPASPSNDVMAYEESAPASAKITLDDIDQKNREPHEEARAAVDAAFGAVPFTPANNPQQGIGSQLFGEVNHNSSQQGSSSLPPLPDFSTLPPLPPPPSVSGQRENTSEPDKLEDMLTPAPAPTVQPQSNDPAQYKIPGQ